MLAFRIVAPMLAWGNHLAGSAERPTSRFPSRSAILGLIGAALGYRRSDRGALDDLREQCLLAFAMHGAPRLQNDFRTYMGAKGRYWSRAEALKGNTLTSLTDRWHVEGVAYRVFVLSKREQEIHDALIHPRYMLFFGRVEFPAGPLHPKILQATTLTDGLEEYPLDGKGWWFDHLKEELPRIAWDDGFTGPPEARECVVRRDEPICFEERIYTDRREWRT